MIDVTIKTLDSRTRSFTVPEQITVKDFKERIASSVEISAGTQRLIFRGRVLQDDKKLNDYDVHGQTIHLVEKPPPSSRPPPTSQPPTGSTPTQGAGQRDGNSFFVGAITLPAELTEAGEVQRIVQQVVSGMGEVGRNARVTSRASADGSSVDVHINLGSINLPQVSEVQQRITHVQQLLRQANQILGRLETSPHMYHTLHNHPQQTGTQTEPQSSTQSEDMDTTPATESSSSANTSSASGGASASAGGATSTSGSESTASGGQRNSESGPVHPRAPAMADVFRDINRLNTRLQPHLDKYQTLLRTDPAFPAEEFARRQEAQRLQNLTSQVLHIVSHIYHSVSDCMVDLHAAPPRILNAPPIVTPPMMPHIGVPSGFGAIPVQVNIGPAAPAAAGANQARTGNTPPTTAATQQPTTTTPTTSATPAPNTSVTSASTTSATPAQTTSATPAPTTSATLAPTTSATLAPTTSATPAPTTSATSAPTTSATPAPTTSATLAPTTSANPSTSASTASTSSAATGGRQISTSAAQPTISITNSTRTFVIRPNGPPGANNQNRPGRSITIRGPAGIRFTAPGGSTIQSSVPANQGGPRPGHVRGPHIQIRHVQMPGGATGQAVPLPANLMQGIMATLMAQAQQHGQQFSAQAGQQSQGQNGQSQHPASSSSTSSTTSTTSSSSAGEGQRQSQTTSSSDTIPSTSSASSTSTPTSTSNPTASDPSTANPGATNPSSTNPSTTNPSAANPNRANPSSANPNSANPRMSTSSTQATFHTNNANAAHLHPAQILLNPLLQQSNVWDPFLNCQSRHIAATRLLGAQQLFSRLTPTQTGRSTPGSNAGRPEQQAQDEGAPAGENAFADMIGGLVGALINQPGGQFTPQTSTSGNTAGTSGNTAGTPGGRPGQTGSTPNSSAATSSTSSSSSSSTSFTFGPFTGIRSSVTGVPSPISEEVMVNIMGEMSRQFGGADMGGQPVDQSLSDFFRSLGYTPDPSEGFLNDLVNMICQNLSMPDLAAIFFGNTASLQAMRSNLQQFVNDRIMRGEAMTPGNIEIAVDRLIEEIRPIITSMMQSAETVNNIDPVKSNIAFLRELLLKFIALFVGPSGTNDREHLMQNESKTERVDRNQFGDHLLQLVRNGMHEWVCLMIHTFGGREGFHVYMENLLETLLSPGDHQEMANLAVSVSLTNLDTIANSMQVTVDQIRQYIVKRETQPLRSGALQTDGAEESQPVSSSENSTNGRTNKRQREETNEAAMQLETTEPSTVPDSTQSAAAVAAPAPPTQLGSNEAGVTNGAAAVGGAMAAEPIGSRVVPNWQAAVPEEWVPVMNQDIIRQRRQAPQAPLSDAYLSGMPAKKLKLMQGRTVPVSNGMETYIPETLRRAIGSAGVQPITSMDTVMQEAKDDSQLHKACEEQVQSAVKERLRRDPDYNPSRSPNSEKYFQKK